MDTAQWPEVIVFAILVDEMEAVDETVSKQGGFLDLS
jgi:hypothetical protein